MPYMARRCANCKTLLQYVGPCPVCKAKRANASGWVYRSPKWRRLRSQVLSEEPLCRACRNAMPVHVDHIQPIVSRPDLAFVRSNLQALCAPCHSRKTATEK